MELQNTLIENVKGLKELGLLSSEKIIADEKVVETAVKGKAKSTVYHEEIAGNGSIAFSQINTINSISKHITVIKANVDSMIDERRKANKIEDARERAIAYCDHVKPYFDQIRYHVDKLELLTDDELWPLPKYREILFTK